MPFGEVISLAQIHLQTIHLQTLYLSKNFIEISILNTFRLGSDPEQVFPFSALHEQLQKFGKYALVQVSFVLPILMAEIDIDLENNNSSPDLTDTFNKRLRDIASDLYRLGYIWTKQQINPYF